jgi:AcrR family transcriptional regulator
MRKLAQELDVGAASLYWHVGDKEELLGLLLDRIVGEAEVPEPDPENWQEQVKELARETAGCCQRHRDAAQISLGRDPVGPHSMPVLERNLACSAAAGLPPRVIALAADMFALFVGGFAFEESMRPASAPTRPARRVLPLAPAEQFPTLVALADDLTAGDADERFEFALELLCAGSRRWRRRGLAQALLGQLRPRLLALLQRQPHPAQHLRAFVNCTSRTRRSRTRCPTGRRSAARGRGAA